MQIKELDSSSDVEGPANWAFILEFLMNGKQYVSKYAKV